MVIIFVIKISVNMWIWYLTMLGNRLLRDEESYEIFEHFWFIPTKSLWIYFYVSWNNQYYNDYWTGKDPRTDKCMPGLSANRSMARGYLLSGELAQRFRSMIKAGSWLTPNTVYNLVVYAVREKCTCHLHWLKFCLLVIWEKLLHVACA